MISNCSNTKIDNDMVINTSNLHSYEEKKEQVIKFISKVTPTEKLQKSSI